MKKSHRKEKISFRFMNLPNEMLPFLKEALAGTELQVKSANRGRGLVVAFDLGESERYEEVKKFIQKHNIKPSGYGLWISLVTEADSDGVHVPANAVDLLRQVGGQLDFSFVTV